VQLTVARIGRAHGMRGEVVVDLRSDTPDERFAPGAVLRTVPPSAGPLTVERSRGLNGRWFLLFEGVTDRTAAEALRGVELVVDSGDTDAAEEDAWYPHQLAGLRVEHVDGRTVGTVLDLEHLPAHDLLVIREPSGTRTLVPFVRAIVTVVDIAGGRVVLDPPGGLLADDGEPEA
jgi:16S rRNA processing protein RimM